MNKSIKILVKWIIGPVLAAWLFWSLYQQIKAQPDINSSIALIKAMPFGSQAWKFWLVILFVFVNWGMEARKWQILMKPLQPLSFITAFKSVLCGVTLSLNTPNRMGEYGGRILFVNDGNRIKAITLSIAGGMAQLIITMLMGCFGLMFLLFGKDVSSTLMGVSVFWIKIFLYGSVFGTIVFIFFFFKLGFLIRLLEKLPYANRFSKYINILETFEAKVLLRLLSISFFRYIVFVLQYIFMLQLLHVEQNVWTGFWIITVMFWILAIIPSFAIAELGIRGTVAKTLFSYSLNTLGILTATFGIWFVNLFIPALIGSLLILGIKIKK
ncbi:MAG: flippase-like domain-containing protein [Ferruginibacter sp.]|nr:flippase-like domain-containing protein [Bacteroidota bacterium]MBX2917731.1 flippase-like domain-containing protein [Ferruginibacter sp.]MCB0708537.1 flippase-like domain-containing protein [Chitinophagaceae bacterium]MCC7378055.1 flippase-like domain-containing protein [Chitinophagaceae bacterium]